MHLSQIDRARTDTVSGLKYKERRKVDWPHPKGQIQKDGKEDFFHLELQGEKPSRSASPCLILQIWITIMVDAEWTLWIGLDLLDDPSYTGSGCYGWCDRSVSSWRQPKCKAISTIHQIQGWKMYLQKHRPPVRGAIQQDAEIFFSYVRPARVRIWSKTNF